RRLDEREHLQNHPAGSLGEPVDEASDPEAATASVAISGCSTVKASTMARKSMRAARYHGAPGSIQPCLELMNQAKVKENKPGPMSMAIARMLLIAPCNSPC